MDVKELRIGNLVKDDECIIVIVEALSGDNALVNGYGENEVLFYRKGYPNVLFESEIYPIELTEELIFKCGFEKVKSNYEYAECFDYVLQPIYFDMSNTSIKINGVYQAIKYPKYLHELQNLYFALTGQELDISQLINN